ncbi:MAG: thymidine kinase [Bacteroidota bacterium]|nr:thymidine kinase [Flavobacteriales bacterium]MEC7476947.1 thymidine kinase [Bacteroidota bacterium]MEC7950565.1 thymidine kinase [Bacteroidota bacterium]MEC8361215.1 thymidine kinase [Bacteroidota bacterium]MEC8368269.1 thymidine kinase [Bacteroidota bacterium]
MQASDQFSSPQGLPAGEGRLEVICGPMFSGKTEELLRRIRRAQIAKLPVALFKPATDKRYDDVEVVSHDKNAMSSIVVNGSQALWDHIQDARQREPGRREGFSIVAVDEAQFFDKGLPEVCNNLANQGYRVIVAGLDLDYEGVPFGPMPLLLALAEEVTKLHAVCVETGRAAHFSHRIAGGQNQVELGAQDRYIPLARHAYVAANQTAVE